VLLYGAGSKSTARICWRSFVAKMALKGPDLASTAF